MHRFCLLAVVILLVVLARPTCAQISVDKETRIEEQVKMQLTIPELYEWEWLYLDEGARARMSAKKDELLPLSRQSKLRETSFEISSELVGFNLSGQIGDGLGPLHNGTSCAECHPNGSSSGVANNVTLIAIEPRSRGLTHPDEHSGENLLKVFPNLLSSQGIARFEVVLHNRSAVSNQRYQEIRNRIRDYVPGGILDEWYVPEKRTSAAIAKQPVMAGRHEDWDFYLSQRNTPPLFGLMMIDRIRPKSLIKLAEKQAEETGGRITGRYKGRFGWRGQLPSLATFVGQGLSSDLGLTHPNLSQVGDPLNPKAMPPGYDVIPNEVKKLVQYIERLPVPEENPITRELLNGERLFGRVGCIDCHVGDVPPAYGVFSDFLLHDMGQRLQAPSPTRATDTSLVAVPQEVSRMDTKGPATLPGFQYNPSLIPRSQYPMPEEIEKPAKPQFPRGDRPANHPDPGKFTWDDLQREWKTPPLWGLADSAPYLHDGRAETIEEAIEWHGGEAQDSADLYAAL
ncbi:MAG: di-heme oxidoredictase family protein, partial [Planctomycetota bacterium]